jgi:hypothetical protein
MGGKAIAWTASALVAATGVAAGVTPDRSVHAPGPIAQLSSASLPLPANQHAAFVTGGGCPKVGVWRLTRVAQTFASRECARTYGLSLSDSSARWGTVRKNATGTRYELWRSAAGVRRTRDPYSEPKALIRRAVAPGQPAPFILYEGTHWLNGRLAGLDSTTLESPPLRAAASRATLAVLDADGALKVYLAKTARADPVLVEAQYGPREVKAIKAEPRSSQYLVLVAGRLDMFSGVYSKTTPAFSVSLPAADSYGDDSCYRPSCPVADLRLADFDWPYAVYVRGRAIHFLHLRTRKNLVVRRPRKAPVHAQLEPGGLTYSHGNQISYLGRKKIDALFRR